MVCGAEIDVTLPSDVKCYGLLESDFLRGE